MSRHQDSQLVKGAFLLTLAGLISKILSAAYRIPLQNFTGDFGFYIYQQVYPFLGMMIILSLYGFPSAIAKMTAELHSKGKKVSIRSTYGPLFFILFIIISIVSFLLWFNADVLANWMGDRILATAYRWVAIALLSIPFTSILRGIFQGYQKVNEIAYSQVGEQIVRVLIIMLAAILIANGHMNVYQMGTFGVLASIFGALTAISILLIGLRRVAIPQSEQFSIPWRYYVRTLFMFGIVASLNHMVLLIIQFADVFTLVPNLMKSGLSTLEAMEAKGIFDRGQPLIQLGTVLGSSFALALVPTVAKEKLSYSLPYIRSSLKISFYIAIGAVIGLIFIFEETNVLLYQDAKGTSSLQVLSLSIFLSSLSITIIAILQSLGYLKRTALFIVGAFGVKWIGNVILVPYLGMMGGAIATVIGLLFLFVTGLSELNRQIPIINLRKHIRFQPLIIATICMMTFLFVVKALLPYDVIHSRFSLLIYVLFMSGVGALIYLLLLIRYDAFSKKEIQMFPFASFLVRIYKGRD